MFRGCYRKEARKKERFCILKEGTLEFKAIGRCERCLDTFAYVVLVESSLLLGGIAMIDPVYMVDFSKVKC